MFAYHHKEALYCFDQALQADPQCVIAHLASAYAVGPNYNFTWQDMERTEKESVLRQALHHLHCAHQKVHLATPIEQAWLQALTMRYPTQDWENNKNAKVCCVVPRGRRRLCRRLDGHFDQLRTVVRSQDAQSQR